MGRPSTTMVCVDGSRSTGMSSLRSMVTSSPTSRMARLHLVAQVGAAGHVGGPGDQHAEGEPAPDHHLFDVQQVDLVPRQHLEQRRRDAWLIDAR